MPSMPGSRLPLLALLVVTACGGIDDPQLAAALDAVPCPSLPPGTSNFLLTSTVPGLSSATTSTGSSTYAFGDLSVDTVRGDRLTLVDKDYRASEVRLTVLMDDGSTRVLCAGEGSGVSRESLSEGELTYNRTRIVLRSLSLWPACTESVQGGVDVCYVH